MLMTPEQLGERIQRPTTTLAQWRYRSEGPNYLKVGGTVRYDEADVDAWLNAQRVKLNEAK